MKKLLIACDVDGVVADLSAEWYRRYNLRYNDDLTPARVTDWDTSKFVKPECGKRIFEILNEPDLYAAVPEIQGAREGVAALRAAGHRVVFVSSCVVGAMDQKYRWLLEHGFVEGAMQGGQSKDVIFAHSKDMIRADLLIDDGPHNVEAWPGTAILVDGLYNRHVRTSGFLDRHRASDWAEILVLVGFLSK